MSSPKMSKNNSTKTHNWTEYYHRVGGFNIVSSIMDPVKNMDSILKHIDILYNQQNCSLIVSEELSVCGYGCQHGIQFEWLLKSCKEQVSRCMRETRKFECVITLGLPYQVSDGRIFNVAVVIYQGKILGMVPKNYLPNYTMFSEKKYFTSGEGIILNIDDNILGTFLFSSKQLFNMTTLTNKYAHNCEFAVTICEDDWAPIPLSTFHSLAGAQLIVNMSSSPAIVSKHENKLDMFSSMSRSQMTAIVYVAASCTQPVDEYVNDGMIAAWNCGGLLSENLLFQRSSQMVFDIDIVKIMVERRINQTRSDQMKFLKIEGYVTNLIKIERKPISKLNMFLNKRPFVPQNESTMTDRAKTIRLIKATALTEKLLSMPKKDKTRIVFGFSAGVDSTDAALTAADAMDRFVEAENPGKQISKAQYMERRKQVIGVMMPGSGTTTETNTLSKEFLKLLGFEVRTVDINPMSEDMLKLMGHKQGVYNTAYESVFARDRTRVLLGIAGEVEGLYLGTGDLSEIAQGWNTFMGDQLAQYNCNGGIPKTLIQFNCYSYAKEHPEFKNLLDKILKRDISPELIPESVLKEQGKETQRSEDSLGDYTLIDFFLFHFLSMRDPKYILYLAIEVFSKDNVEDTTPKTFTPEYIKTFLVNFVRRFHFSQYKRTICSPGPLVGYLSLASREVWRFPDNAQCSSICDEISKYDV